MDIIEKHFGAMSLPSIARLSDVCYGTEKKDDITTSFKTIKNESDDPYYDVYGAYTTDGRLAYVSVCTTDELPSDWGGCKLGEIFIDSGVLGIFSENRYNETRGEVGAKEEWYWPNVMEQKQVARFDDTDECFLFPLAGVPDGRYSVYGFSDEDGNVESFTVRFLQPDSFDDYEVVCSLSSEDDLEEAIKNGPVLSVEDDYKKLAINHHIALNEGFQEIMEKIYYRDHHNELQETSSWEKYSELALDIYYLAVKEYIQKFPTSPSFFEIDEYGESESDDFKEEMLDKFIARIAMIHHPEEYKKFVEWIQEEDIYFFVECHKGIRECKTEEELKKYFNGYLSGGVE